MYNNDVYEFYTIKCNQIKMMKLRLCRIDKDDEKILEKEKFFQKIYKGSTDISVLDNDYRRGDKKFKVKFMFNKAKEDRGNEDSGSKMIEKLVHDSLKGNTEYIIITNIAVKNIKILKTKGYSDILSVFSFEEMYIFPPDHIFVPPHFPIYDPDDYPFDQYSEELQTIKYEDIQIKFLGLKKGQLVLIRRLDPIAGIRNSYNIYKLVV